MQFVRYRVCSTADNVTRKHRKLPSTWKRSAATNISDTAFSASIDQLNSSWMPMQTSRYENPCRCTVGLNYKQLPTRALVEASMWAEPKTELREPKIGWSRAVSGRSRKRWSWRGAGSGRSRCGNGTRSEARSGRSRCWNGAGSGGYKNGFDRGATFLPLTLRSHAEYRGVSSIKSARPPHIVCILHHRHNYFIVIPGIDTGLPTLLYFS